MNARCPSLWIALALTIPALAQNIDSLRTVGSNSALPDTLRAQALEELVNAWSAQGEADSALAVSREVVAFCSSRNLTSRIGAAEGMLGRLFARGGQYDSARVWAMRAVVQHHRDKNTSLECDAELIIGLSFNLQGLRPEALKHDLRALSLVENTTDSAALAHCHNNLGALYTDMGRYDEAMEHMNKAVAMMRATHDPRIRNALAQLGIIHEGRHEYDKALSYLEESVEMCRILGDDETRSRVLQTIANIQFAQGHNSLAIATYERSSGLTGSSYTHIQNAINMGIVLMAAGRRKEAIERFKEAIGGARADNDLVDASLAYKELSNAYDIIGDKVNAYSAYKYHIELRDSVANDEKTRELTRIEMNYTFGRKQLADSLVNAAEREQTRLMSEATMAKEKNRRNVFMFSGIGLFLAAGGLALRLRETRRSRAAIQVEKDISEGLLLNILPAEVAEELKRKGHAIARHFDQATILFTDFKGFTSVSENLSPAELVEELNVCFKVFDNIITGKGIEKIKTIGDAYMCAGGLPDPQTSSPVAVVYAALEMQAFMTLRKLERDGQGLPAFEMRVGIHTGPVVAGIVGVKKFAYDIWGDTVNIASRMESSGAVGQVNISEATYLLLKDEQGLTFTPRGKVQAKGKGEMEMYFVERT